MNPDGEKRSKPSGERLQREEVGNRGRNAGQYGNIIDYFLRSYRDVGRGWLTKITRKLYRRLPDQKNPFSQ